MAWERFSYICRRALNTLKTEESLADCFSRVDKEPGCEFYGKNINPNDLSHKLLSEIKQIPDREKACEAIKAYSEINLCSYLSEPMQLKRVTIYLAYITFVFFIVSGIYQTKVTPLFIEAFDIFGLQVPSYITLYQNYWHYFVISVSVFLMLSLLVGYKLKSLFKFKSDTEKDFVFRFLTLPGIRKSYLNLITLISFPISNAIGNQVENKTSLENHLVDVSKSKMSLAKEIKELIEKERQSLLSLCEKQMRFISVTVALFIIAAIYFFLSSVYSPIFVMGEII